MQRIGISQALHWSTGFTLTLIALLSTLSPVRAQGFITLTAPSVVQGTPGASSSFQIGMINNSDAVIQLQSFSIKITLPNTTTASYTGSTRPTSNYVFNATTTTGFTVLESTPTTLFVTDSVSSGFVTLNPGDTRSLMNVTFTFAANATTPVNVDFVLDNTQFLQSINNEIGFSTPSITLNPVPEPSGILALAAIGLFTARTLRKRRSAVK